MEEPLGCYFQVRPPYYQVTYYQLHLKVFFYFCVHSLATGQQSFKIIRGQSIYMQIFILPLLGPHASSEIQPCLDGWKIS